MRVLVDAGSEQASWAGLTDAEGRVGVVTIGLFFLEVRLSARRPAVAPTRLALRLHWPLAAALACLLLGLGALARVSAEIDRHSGYLPAD